ncbi:hypothetical protein [Geminocystis sp. GBBB08]|uniref:hypothetical protein n=1 Tax=Geminocystis sp. GBBB08 TaxID=2604140 RepID=UPI0027E34622|nr:hypothetical protein [Geminocystis sp. GBBB08]
MRLNHPIDLNSQYPCPCHRKGILLPIILTEAMGCDRCQHIFVVTEKEGYIEQLNPSYSYKKRWRWNGKRWILTNKPWQENYFLWGIISFFFFILVSTPLLIALNSGINLISGTIIGSILILLCFSLWLASRR